MSTFVAFGIFPHQYKEAEHNAELKTLSQERGAVRPWNDRKRELRLEKNKLHFIGKIKPYPLSAPLNAPQICQDFIDLAEKTKHALDMRIMRKELCEKLVKLKGGKTKIVKRMEWVAYK